ncbi:MAG: hypothetical protein QM790_13410 [Nibricoccus sp.]
MPHPRLRRRLAPSEHISLRLNPEQRDWLMHGPDLPQNLGHLLHRAAVREGKLTVRLNREELDACILCAVKIRPLDKTAERGIDALLRYLESQADRFAEPDEAASSTE